MLKKHNKHGPMKWFAGVLAAAGLLLALPAAQPVYAAGDTGSSDAAAIQTAYVGFSAVSDVKVNNVSVKKYGYYQISFDGNDATDGEIDPMKELNISEKVTLPPNVFTRKGFTFLGWSRTKQDPFKGTPKAEFADKASINPLSDTDGANVTLYAVWQRNTNTATYHDNLADGKTITQKFLTGDTENTIQDNSFVYPDDSTPGKTFELTPGTYRWVVPVTGNYTFEMAGGSGGDVTGAEGGKGGYVKGTVKLTEGEVIYLHSGTAGRNLYGSLSGLGYQASGGYASDVRVGTDDYNHRIIVAAGGGGAAHYYYGQTDDPTMRGGDGGGLTGQDAPDASVGFVHPGNRATGATQTGGGIGLTWEFDLTKEPYQLMGSFGQPTEDTIGRLSGGYGWYAGSGVGGTSGIGSGSGGSSYISGYEGCTPFAQIPGGGDVQKSHQFTDMTMTGGANEGDGYVKITTPAGVTHKFSGWNTKADGTGSTYSVGSSLSTLTDSIDLYARWENIQWQAPVNTDDKSEARVGGFNSRETDGGVDVISVDEQKKYNNCYFILCGVSSQNDSLGLLPGDLEDLIKIDNGTLTRLSDSEIDIVRQTVESLDGTKLQLSGSYVNSDTSDYGECIYWKITPINPEKEVKVYTDYKSTIFHVGLDGGIYALRKDRFDGSSGAKQNLLNSEDTAFDTNY